MQDPSLKDENRWPVILLHGEHRAPGLLDSKSNALFQKLLNATHMRSPPRADLIGRFLYIYTDVSKS